MKSLIASICILGMVGMVVGVVVKGAEDTVTATVTPGEVSVTVSPDTVPYGSMVLGDTDDSGTITATAGTAAVDLTIKGTNATYNEVGEIEKTLCADINSIDVCTWTLSPAVGAAAYVHAYTIDLGEVSGTTIVEDYTTGWEDLTASDQDLSLDLAGGANQTFKLDMRTPSSAGGETAYGKQYSTVVTVTASYAY